MFNVSVLEGISVREPEKPIMYVAVTGYGC